MIKKPDRNATRKKRHRRIRNKISGSTEVPRLNVYRSLNNIFVQVIDDVNGVTITSASTLSPELKGSITTGSNVEVAAKVGELIATKAIEKGIKKVVFDRAGYLYHGRVKALAEAARQKGLEF